MVNSVERHVISGVPNTRLWGLNRGKGWGQEWAAARHSVIEVLWGIWAMAN